MNRNDAIRILQDIGPVFEMSGLNQHRAIKDDELVLLRDATKKIADSANEKKIEQLVKLLPSNFVHGAILVSLHTLGESANRMLQARRDGK